MSEFQVKVLAAVKKIPFGMVTTYGAIAAFIGSPKAARAVGNALHKNPTPIVIPCHRVTNGEGRLALNFRFGGAVAQKSLHESEGVEVSSDYYVDLERFFFGFEG